jgi:ADP-ribose pyrophosphatase
LRDRVLSSETIFEGEVLTLRVDQVEAADGHHSSREVVVHRGAVGIVCVHDGDIVLVKQYRHATGEELLEIPAGKLDPGEQPDETVARELVEEVGLHPRSLEHLATYYTTPGFTNELFHLYLCTDAEVRPGKTDDGEVVEVVRRPVSSLRELLASGEVRDAKSLLGLALLALRSP